MIVQGLILNHNTGKPLPGPVNVFVSDSRGRNTHGTGTTTNSNGSFTLEVPFGAEYITLSHIGYKSSVLYIPRVLNNHSNGVFTLEEKTAELEEAVVTSPPNTTSQKSAATKSWWSRNWEWFVPVTLASGFLIAGVRKEDAEKAIKNYGNKGKK